MARALSRHLQGGHYYKPFTGASDASASFQEEKRRVLTKAVLKRGKYNPSTYYHENVGIKAIVNGNDFASLGSRKALIWFGQVLESRFEISTVAVGDGQKKYNGIIRTMRIGTTKHNNDMESSS